jgi:hypothetical protein
MGVAHLAVQRAFLVSPGYAGNANRFAVILALVNINNLPSHVR